MMNEISYTLVFVGHAVVLFCILYYWKKLEKVQRWFGLFLVWGFVNDLKLVFVDDMLWSDRILAFYVLTEIPFYGWFIFSMSKGIFPKRLQLWFYVLLLPFWVLCFFVLEDSTDNDFYSSIYDGVSAAFISCIAAWALVKMSEQPRWGQGIRLESSPRFWFLGGVFLYFFCSIFIFSIISREVSERAWIVHNVINLLAMLIYSVGFVLAGRGRKAQL
ncbi:MAG: hypothetical protein ACKVOR_05205 [Flavobacteriales bacterium]